MRLQLTAAQLDYWGDDGFRVDLEGDPDCAKDAAYLMQFEPGAKPLAEHICLAVNSHKALVSALRAADLMLSLLPVRDDSEEKARREVKDAARAALKKAEGL